MEASVDKEACISCGLCPDTCGDVFEMQDDGKAGVIVNEVPETSEDSAMEARDNCPVNAISVE